jgi:hypothetical protein
MLIQINWNPDRKQLRNFGLTMLGMLVAFGALLAWKYHAPKALYGCAAGGAVVALCGIFLPPAGLALYKAWMGLGFCLGAVMSPVFLALVYFLILTPVGLLLRAGGRDSLQRRRRADRSFWRKIDHRTRKESYERQF